jgi:hypothetical protein
LKIRKAGRNSNEMLKFGKWFLGFVKIWEGPRYGLCSSPSLHGILSPRFKFLMGQLAIPDFHNLSYTWRPFHRQTPVLEPSDPVATIAEARESLLTGCPYHSNIPNSALLLGL